MTWENQIEEFKNFLNLEKGLSFNTLLAYIQDIEKLRQFVVEIKKLQLEPNVLDSSLLEEFIFFIAELGVSQATQARIISGVRAFYKFLLISNRIQTNPATLLEAPKIGRKIPDVLSIEQIDKMINSIDLSQSLAYRNRAIIETLYSCGLRVSELAQLKISNVFVEQEFIRVIGKGDKQRLVPISNQALTFINEYFNFERKLLSIPEKNQDFVFLNRRGQPLSRVMIFYIVKEVASIAGISKNIHPHTFRHSFATHMVEAGADLRAVQEMLGHQSILTTEIYTHIDQNFLRQTILLHHPHSKK